MTMDSYRSTTSHSPFRSRRSHPALNHISLAPLTPRFPIDDLPDSDDYFSGNHGQTTSYLSSSSVPTTPPILSHSRANSRTRHHKRSKSTTHVLSDTDLQSLGGRRPLQQYYGGKRGGARTPGPETKTRHDSEWLLRAGLALASSTREEKGQSWLLKRESSTSLVTEPEPAEIRSHRHGRSTHRSRSGLSTPAALSRQTSRSRGGSRRASRAELSMTAIDAVAFKHSRKSSIDSRHSLLPDFVDEQIRAEIASIHQQGLEDDSSLSSSESDSELDDDIDEKEFQRLTRERGFGLGSWIDQFVGWTLFGVEEDYAGSPPEQHAERTVTFHESPSSRGIDSHVDDEDDGDGENEFTEAIAIGKAGEQGGWEDASWFLRLAKKAIV
ncbi:hypothetical protein BGW36DRAFT_163372 [Talaromyces proteolyticus]|uniref:Uncharacterized protein n=1 Tax=Talaromyces proteolyticus TaxID=1131652 RepID=A0AAD4KNZ0_9EURO|nr:uncharacterized protein BGW36DRAFT_163372 [Talaromyces proteolyticus]KAH8697207.1 hypothetical protein BGW36DRAFT_163372 [Talaromyces proteolyticus]